MSLLCLKVTDEITITEPLPTDKEAVIQHLADPEITSQMNGIPFPFGPEEFDWMMNGIYAASVPFQHPIHFAVRDSSAWLTGFSDLVVDHKAEIGYWLAKPLRGQGIMTQAVRAACEFAVTRWGLRRISATVFEGNVASIRVLEKCGFELEGLHRRHDFKDGRYIDSWAYALLPDVCEVPF